MATMVCVTPHAAGNGPWSLLPWRPPLYATGMAHPSDLEARVAALEARMGELTGRLGPLAKMLPLPGTWPPRTTGT